MSTFKFKRFSVSNEKSAMKVNTDGVLLGAIMEIRPEDRHFLDIGTGTGTIALMAAQRASEQENRTEDYRIEAIDIDQASAEEAAMNFKQSDWGAHLDARNIPFNTFAEEEGLFDLIFSNPPYFDRSMAAPEMRRNAARHTDSLSYKDILEYSSTHLNPDGRTALVLPHDLEKEVSRYGRMNGLGIKRITRIKTVPRKSPSRIILEFTPGKWTATEENVLTIQDGGTYSAEYLQLMKKFYLFA